MKSGGKNKSVAFIILVSVNFTEQCLCFVLDQLLPCAVDPLLPCS